MSCVLAVDPGEARIGLAISDPSGLIARPLKVLHHKSRRQDARDIADTAAEYSAGTIVVGVALGLDGETGPQARRALRLIETLKSETDVTIDTWDESGSTLAAISLSGRRGKLDARAAAVILQEYLDARRA